MTLMRTGTIRVLLIDDHELVVEGLSRILAKEEDLEIVGRATTAAEGIELAGSAQPDVVLLDHRLPDRDGVEAIGDLREACPGAKVVVLTGFATKKLASDAIGAGCDGFILKTRGTDEVVRALRAAADDEVPVDPSMTSGLLARSADNTPSLTPRELEILRMLADGTSTRAIAGELYVSVKTVRNHIQNTMKKLDAHSRIAAIAAAKRLGLVA